MKNKIILALLSAFLLWLGWPPVPYSAPVLFVAFVPLLVAIEQVIRSHENNKGRQVFWLSFLTGFVWNTASIYWVYNAMNAYLPGYISLLIALIPFTLAPLLMATAFRLYYQLRKKKSIVYSFIGLVSFWLSYEFLHQSWDLAFPWMTLGNGFANFHQLVQWYSITGVYGGSLWIWMVNILLFLLIWQKMNKIEAIPNLRLWIITLLVVTIPTVLSLVQYNTFEEHSNPSEIVVVQPNIDPYQKFGRITPEEQLTTLIALSEKVAKPNTEFFIWPETAISAQQGINEDEFRSQTAYSRIITFLDKYKNGNVLSGIESYRVYNAQKTPTARKWSANTYVDAFNAAVLVDQSSKLQFYHKSKLVPGVEQMPFSDALAFMKPLFAHFGGTTGGYGSQEEPSVFYAASGIGAAPVICYESIWGDYVAEYARQGAQFIAIVTNDGWWGNTSGKDQHLQYAKLRAIENRRWVARSANTGISGFINQRGDIVQKTTWWQPDALTQEINLNEELTFYTKHGDLLIYIVLVSSLFSLLLIIIPKRK
ncbi:apolipoprotein N-acyltransferase [Sphingobacterium psychroaquaticum]|uniref:apolipoprotein N-acyltransferase n=1 Tax=Sphingobacterium psychroaquaticum TaxID=561061 RepID=UPI00106BC676|nr:apolipoprotein N-acyltransferase [Sphingobacterium psychroaquaticum]QBQ40144.1 apolipoprotein N-acyltransferase [Sphingobacterium psychroaquaticum]